jgi:hypothetical protein
MPRTVYVLPYNPSRTWKLVVRICFAIAILASMVHFGNRTISLMERNKTNVNATYDHRTTANPGTSAAH